MTTRSPSRYEGAVIQGVVSAVNESGRMTGRAGMSLSLQSIRLPNGRSYQFEGVIEDIIACMGSAADRSGAPGVDADRIERLHEIGQQVIDERAQRNEPFDVVLQQFHEKSLARCRKDSRLKLLAYFVGHKLHFLDLLDLSFRLVRNPLACRRMRGYFRKLIRHPLAPAVRTLLSHDRL